MYMYVCSHVIAKKEQEVRCSNIFLGYLEVFRAKVDLYNRENSYEDNEFMTAEKRVILVEYMRRLGKPRLLLARKFLSWGDIHKLRGESRFKTDRNHSREHELFVKQIVKTAYMLQSLLHGCIDYAKRSANRSLGKYIRFYDLAEIFSQIERDVYSVRKQIRRNYSGEIRITS